MNEIIRLSLLYTFLYFPGIVVQLVRAPPCQGGSCGFEPRQSRRIKFLKYINRSLRFLSKGIQMTEFHSQRYLYLFFYLFFPFSFLSIFCVFRCFLHKKGPPPLLERKAISFISFIFGKSFLKKEKHFVF